MVLDKNIFIFTSESVFCGIECDQVLYFCLSNYGLIVGFSQLESITGLPLTGYFIT